MESRRNQALNVRIEAAKFATGREHPIHKANGEELQYRFAKPGAGASAEDSLRGGKPSYITNYTKGLPHREDDGLIADPNDFQQFVRGIDSGDTRDFRDTPLGPLQRDASGQVIARGAQYNQPITWQSGFTNSDAVKNAKGGSVDVRAWESQGAGNTFDLQGPDAQAVTMPPAPVADSDELIAEMAEVYEMALLRDVPFAKFAYDGDVNAAIARLNHLAWFNGSPMPGLSPEAQARRRGEVTQQNAFRGTTFGDNVGPYLSQFLCAGTPELGSEAQTEDSARAGLVQYGALVFQSKVRVATPYRDYMTTWESWLDVQNGADLRGTETYEGDCPDTRYRFIATPRDLATYVHYDALYEAYLNACLAMLALKVPFDPGVPFQGADILDRQQGFAHFGGPHILSLVTEVATRALKAVRFQKFNVHRRLRPEAIGGRLHRMKNTSGNPSFQPFEAMCDRLSETGLLEAVRAHNARQNSIQDGRDEDQETLTSYLLPMAFPEGSPMHPAYGAGHATVAGACVTILKAFFDHRYVLPRPYVCPAPSGQSLEVANCVPDLTVEGELNKLASNISIGRNWAGVHYFTDYSESVRMGEAIAIGILEEQKLTYGENFSMSVPLFDGQTVRI
ncbi:vanadium-dependent haloperoxidase [Oscillatoria sp. CS-180]|uniref:vanadium-dependent haloperoxidase n=1 Tax=Oscillatoria sp. CS-180 TaxID=3021720 RepID=UPI00232F849C|nr:vanadium-dependent haloperoxidase [Oscillatoria sp. CS-180]MDB9525973.1 vanadium-dependent haloperoxidase [Oscillatoria sp. CS-180]